MVPRQSKAPRPAPCGRVFAAQAEEPTEVVDRDVVVGMVLVNGVRARVSFDTSATHSFISRPFTKMHGIEVQLSKSTWRLEAPECSFVIGKECLACPVQVGD